MKKNNDFYLCPNDLVYVPSPDELENDHLFVFDSLSKERAERIYKVVSFSGNQIFFVRHDVSVSIVNKTEFSTLNKMERAVDGTMIKEVCVKLKVDRLGNIVKV